MRSKWWHILWAAHKKKKKKKKKRNQIIFLCSKKKIKWCFHVRLQISSWYFRISGVAWKWKQLCRKGFRGEFVAVWIISLGPAWIQAKLGIFAAEVKFCSGIWTHTPCPSLGLCCRGRIARSLPLKNQKHTLRLIHPLPLDEVDNEKFKTSTHFRRCHFSRVAYLPPAIAAYN